MIQRVRVKNTRAPLHKIKCNIYIYKKTTEKGGAENNRKK